MKKTYFSVYNKLIAKWYAFQIATIGINLLSDLDNVNRITRQLLIAIQLL